MKNIISIKALAAFTLSAALAVFSCMSAAASEKPDIQAVRPAPSAAYSNYISGAAVYDESSGVKPSPYIPSGSVLTPDVELPSAYKTATTGIGNQGSYNTCWAFSGIGALEAYLSNDGRGDHDFSEQHLAWWSTKAYNKDGIGWLASTLAYGGYSMISAGYFASWQGPKAEEDIPYVVSGNNKLPSGMDDYDTLYGVTGIVYVNNDITSVKTAIYKYGGVATSFNNGNGYGENKANYYQNKTTLYYSGHAITIIGWDDNYSRFNFNEDAQPPEDGAWLCKNSWGPNKGDNGYLWISYYDKYVLDTNTWGVNLAFTGVRTMTGNDRLYQNEKYGATFYTYLASGGKMMPEVTFANVFDFDDEHNYLQEVIFETQAQDSKYTIWYIPMNRDKPDPNTSKWTKLAQGVVDHMGYICADVSGKVEPQDKAAIGVTINSAGTDDGYAQLGVDEWLINSSGDYIFMPDAKRGESFIINKGTVYDLLDVYAENDDNIGGTLVIKAIASSSVIGDVDGDGSINTNDALVVLRESVGTFTEYTPEQLEKYDINKDGYITSIDALMILRRSVGLIAEF